MLPPNTQPSARPTDILSTDVRTGMTVLDLKQSFLDNLRCGLGRSLERATRRDAYTALALTVRDRVFERGVQTLERYAEEDARVVAYLSAEFLPGPHLGQQPSEPRAHRRGAAGDVGTRTGSRRPDRAGRGARPRQWRPRAAGVVLHGLARVRSRSRPIGYGIRYEFGIFDQAIQDGWQVEMTDKWLRFGNPWEIARPEIAYDVMFGGHTERWTDDHGRYRVRWMPAHRREGRRLRHADPRLPCRHLQSASPVEGRGGRVVRFRRVQSRRLLPGGEGQDALGEHHQGAVSERRSCSRARRSGCSSSSSSSRCSLQDMIRVSPAAGSAARARSTRSGRFSSTTRIRRSPSPS